MTCRPFDLGNGVTGIACTRGASRRRCKECGRTASKQCDYPLRGKAAGRTCDVYLCASCAVSSGPDRDYCPPHSRAPQQELEL